MDHQIEAILAIRDGDVLAAYFGNWLFKKLIYELMPLLKLKSVQQ